jgi:hypothetical protein
MPPPVLGGDVITDRIASSLSILSSLSIRPSESISSNNCIDSVKDRGSEPGVRGDVSPPARQQQLKTGVLFFQKINVLPTTVVMWLEGQ